MGGTLDKRVGISGFDFRKHGGLVKVGSLAKRGKDFDFGG